MRRWALVGVAFCAGISSGAVACGSSGGDDAASTADAAVDGTTGPDGASDAGGDAPISDGAPSDGAGDAAGDADPNSMLPKNDAGNYILWQQQEAYIKASNTPMCGVATYCDFGATVALSADGNTLAVGSPAESSASTGVGGSQVGNTNNLTQYSGAVYVFTRSGATWTQQAYIKASNTGYHNSFGASVSLSADGNTLAVGAPGEDGASTGIGGDQTQTGVDDAGMNHTDSGAVYAFRRAGTTWSQQAYIKASNASYGTYFGTSVAVSGDGATLAVGAPGERSGAMGINGNQNDVSADASGAVYAFAFAANAWSQQAYIKAFNTHASDAFGVSVALSADGSTLVTGAHGQSFFAGAAYAFSRAGVTWSQAAFLKASDTMQNQRFGQSVAVSGDGATIAVGAWQAQPTGHVYMFVRSANLWASQGAPLVAPKAATHFFGWSMALSNDGNRLAVGDNGENSGAKGIDGDAGDTSMAAAGAVWGLTRSGGAWSFQEYVKASNTYAGTGFGYSVAVSSDALTLAVGSWWELSASTGINGSQANSTTAYGAVYVFH